MLKKGGHMGRQHRVDSKITYCRLLLELVEYKELLFSRISYNEYQLDQMSVRVMVETGKSNSVYPTRATPARCVVQK